MIISSKHFPPTTEEEMGTVDPTNTTTREEILNELRDTFIVRVQREDWKPQDITESTRLVDNLRLDSIDRLELEFCVKNIFGVNIIIDAIDPPQSDFTVGQVIDLIMSAMNSHSSDEEQTASASS